MKDLIDKAEKTIIDLMEFGNKEESDRRAKWAMNNARDTLTSLKDKREFKNASIEKVVEKILRENNYKGEIVFLHHPLYIEVITAHRKENIPYAFNVHAIPQHVMDRLIRLTKRSFDSLLR